MSGAMGEKGALLPSRAGSVETALVAAVFAGVLSLQAAALAGLVVGYLVIVAATTTAWALVLDPPGREGIAAIGLVVAVLVSLLSIQTEGAATILLVGAVVALVAAMVLQIARRPPRPGVVASLSSAATLGMVVVAGATLLGLREQVAGRDVTQLFILVAATTLVVGRLADALVPRPALRPGVGVVGIVLGVLAGLGATALLANALDAVEWRHAVGVGVAVTFATAVFAVIVAAVTRPRPRYSDAVLAGTVPLLAAAPSAVLVFGAVTGV